MQPDWWSARPLLWAKSLGIPDAVAKKADLATFSLTVAAVVAGTLLSRAGAQTQMKVLVKNERADMIVSADRKGQLPIAWWRSERGPDQLRNLNSSTATTPFVRL